MSSAAASPLGRLYSALGLRGQTIRQLILQPLLLPLLLLLLLGLVVALGVRGNFQSAELVLQSQNRLNLLSKLQGDVAALENNQRGYVITGSPGDLELYERAKWDFAQHLTQLQGLAASARQRQNAQRLATLVSRWQRQSAEPEIKARDASLDAAVKLVQSGQGKRQLQEARDVLGVMVNSENNRQLRSVQANADSYRNVQRLALGGLLLGSLLLLWSAWRAARRVSRGVQELALDTERVTQGQYDLHIQRSGVRELDHLAAQFQVMATAVQQREAELASARDALENTNLNLQRSNRELERFAYVASHDLQEPLRTIGSYTELLARRYSGQLDERADKYIEFTISATQRLKNLIQDLLAFSRVHRPGRSFTAVDQAELVQEVVSQLAAKIANAGAKVQVEALPVVQGSRELLHHVWLNLIINAVKYRSPERPSQVRVWASREPESWVFHVQDNGIGIEQEYFEKIFEVFQRLHSMGEYEGSGVGLAVTRSAIEQHGGQVWLESVVGQGSTFHFRLPDQPLAQTGAASASLPSSVQPSPGVSTP